MSASHAQADGPYLAFMAMLANRLGQDGRALDLWQQAVRLNPQEGAWWQALGRLQQAAGNRGGARDSYERALATASLDDASRRAVKAALQQLSR